MSLVETVSPTGGHKIGRLVILGVHPGCGGNPAKHVPKEPNAAKKKLGMQSGTDQLK